MNLASSALRNAERFDRRIQGKCLQSETAKTLDSKRMASLRFGAIMWNLEEGVAGWQR